MKTCRGSTLSTLRFLPDTQQSQVQPARGKLHQMSHIAYRRGTYIKRIKDRKKNLEFFIFFNLEIIVYTVYVIEQQSSDKLQFHNSTTTVFSLLTAVVDRNTSISSFSEYLIGGGKLERVDTLSRTNFARTDRYLDAQANVTSSKVISTKNPLVRPQSFANQAANERLNLEVVLKTTILDDGASYNRPSYCQTHEQLRLTTYICPQNHLGGQMFQSHSYLTKKLGFKERFYQQWLMASILLFSS